MPLGYPLTFPIKQTQYTDGVLREKYNQFKIKWSNKCKEKNKAEREKQHSNPTKYGARRL